MRKSEITSLKRKLNYYYCSFNREDISPDPLEFLHRYKNRNDIEIAGLISSVFAYGNVTMILNSIEKVVVIMGDSPYDFVINYNLKDGEKLFKEVRHRFFTPRDVAILFQILHDVYTKCRSLKYFFLLYYFETDNNLKDAISFFSNNLLGIASHYDKITNGLKFMFSDPKKGSACKRMNLFLRWMIRKDDIDLGLWTEIPPSKLVIPVDTHVARISKELGLTKQKNAGWKMAEEITENLKMFDPVDPVKYDFALCHIGMRKLKM